MPAHSVTPQGSKSTCREVSEAYHGCGCVGVATRGEGVDPEAALLVPLMFGCFPGNGALDLCKRRK